MSKLNELTIVDAARGLRVHEFTVRELWDACAAAAHAKNPELNAYLEIFDADDAAIATAQERIEREGDAASMLCGIPLAIKDNILIEGHIASAASKMLENYRATYDATVIKKLKDAGALFVYRTNMDEFAMGSSTEHSAFGPTKNPHDTSRVPGGSSGGSAAAVAAHLCIAALGSDTGGSVRQPAALTGLVGLKPTYGAVSRSGLIAMGSSLDQIGTLAKSVADARILYEAIRGRDKLDSTTIPDGLYGVRELPKRLRVGVPRHLLEKGVDAKVLVIFDAALEKLARNGHTIIDVELPTSAHALAAYYVIMPVKSQPILRVSMVSATGTPRAAKRSLMIISIRVPRVLEKKRVVVSCSVPSYSPPAILMPIIVRRRRHVQYCVMITTKHLNHATSLHFPRRSRLHSNSVKRVTRSRCISKTSSPSLRISLVCRQSQFQWVRLKRKERNFP